MVDAIEYALKSRSLDDRRKVLQVVRECKAELEANLLESGMDFAVDRSAARLGLAEWIDDQWQGIDQLSFLRRLEREIKGSRRGFEEVLARLEEVRNIISNHGDPRVAVTASAEDIAALEPRLAAFTTAPDSNGQPPANWSMPLCAQNEGFAIPSKVNYIGLACNLRSHGYNYHGSMGVLLNLMEYGYLWDLVRRSGGAYGTGVWFYPESGIFMLGSYRDINLLRTLTVFENLPQWLRSRAMMGEELRRGIIGGIGARDVPLSAHDRAREHFQDLLRAVPEGYRQKERDEIFETCVTHSRALADALEEALKHPAAITVLGSRAVLERANERRPELKLEISSLE
jgi:Zn-dependent M16 (insulinase) family peptidase